jgi:5-hydroxyisourate hydrolase-like protein (transthyretin family)
MRKNLQRTILYLLAVYFVLCISASAITLKNIVSQMQTLSENAADKETVSGYASIEGKIVYPDYLGKIIPIADALVRIFPVRRFAPEYFFEMNMDLLVNPTEYPPVRTSDNGFFSIKSIPCGRYYVMTFRQGFKTAMTVVNVQSNQDRQADLMLFPADNNKTGSLFGIVVERISKKALLQFQRNLPVPHIEVQLFHIKPTSVELIRSVITNDQGRYYFADVPCGDYLLKIKHKDYALYRKTIAITPDMPRAVPIIKPAETEFEHLSHYDFYPHSLNQNLFHGELIQYILRMGEGNFSIGPYGNWHPDVNFVKAVLTRDSPAPATQLNGFVYHMKMKDRNASAIPMSNIRILLRPVFPYPTLMTFPEYHAVTSKDGRFVFDRLSSDYHINGVMFYEASIQSKGFEPFTQKIILKPGKENSKNFHMNAYGTLCQFKGKVMTLMQKETRMPISKAALQLVLYESNSKEPARRWMDISDIYGKFKFSDIPPGKYKIVINASGFEPLEIQSYITPGQIYQKDFFLTTYVGPSRLKGKVLNGTIQCKSDETCSQAISGAKVILSSVQTLSQNTSNRQLYEVKTNNQGIYEFVQIQPGHYQMHVSIDRFQPWNALIKISKETVHTKDVQLNPIIESANLTGYIVSKKPNCKENNCQKPIKNADVVLTQQFLSGTIIPIRTQTSEDGRFLFETIPAMSYMVHIDARGYDPQQRKLQLMPGSNEIIYTLDPSVECLRNSDCVKNYFCSKSRGQCERPGICLKLPEICPSVVTPVCGCDGITYNNFCVAAVSGVSIAYHGTCVPAAQTGKFHGTVRIKNTSNKQTIANTEIVLHRVQADLQTASSIFTTQTDADGNYSFERLPAGTYQFTAKAPLFMPHKMTIHIVERQEIHQDIFLSAIEMKATVSGIVRPNCTSGNCFPYISGATVSLTHLLFDSQGKLIPGAVKTTQTDAHGSFSFTDLASGDYRLKIEVDKYLDWEDGFALDGTQKHALDILMDPLKSCFDNTRCIPVQYCQKKEQSCNESGICQKRPITCIMLYDPVCGCDGHTYNNACEAAMAGQNVDFRGRCVPDR